MSNSSGDMVRDSLGWPKIPISVNKFQDMLVGRNGGEENMLLWWAMAAVGWALWKTRNDLVFPKVIIKSPKQI